MIRIYIIQIIHIYTIHETILIGKEVRKKYSRKMKHLAGKKFGITFSKKLGGAKRKFST